MSAVIEDQSEAILPAALDHQHDVQSEMGDGSSSLSDIEQEAEQEDEQDDLDGLESDDASEEENDSEAETERLDHSPNKQRAHKDVVLSSHAESHTFERATSNLHNQYRAEEADEDDDDEEHNIHPDDVSDDELSLPDSPKTATGDPVAEADQSATTAITRQEEFLAEPKDIMHVFDLTNKKRKRSQLVERDSVDATDLGEPVRKRRGSVVGAADEYAIDDNASAHGDVDTPNPISGELSDAESGDGDGQEEEDEVEQPNGEKQLAEEEPENHMDISEDSKSKKIRRKSSANGVSLPPEEVKEPSDKHAVKRPANTSDEGEDVEDIADVEADDAEAILKDEEEQTEEKKRIALEQLNDIEKHFSSFRDRLHEERLAKLNHEEWMLKQDPPIHPEYLAMMQCIDARRDDRLRIEKRRVEYTRETIDKTAVARRAQILSQFYQDVRGIREKKLELLGKQWYEIQHDRRGYGSNVEDYILKFPTKRSDQLKNQYAYNAEVSVLSGIAKYRGFPAAPPMAPATTSELEDDFKKMGKSQQKQPRRSQPSLPLQDIAAIRAATSAAALKPAEEQFIEQTPWANPQHPSHVHLLQRQTSAQQAARTGSPFSMAIGAQPRRHSHQQAGGLPISGTFSGINSISQISSHNFVPGGGSGRPPITAFNAPSLAQKMAPSPLGSRQPSMSPQQSRQAGLPGEQTRALDSHANMQAGRENGHLPAMVSPPGPQDLAHDFSYEVRMKREQAAVANGRF